MTQEEFITGLKSKGYSYRMEGDKIVIIHKEGVDLRDLETLPPGVEFKNDWYVYLGSPETLPPGVELKNSGDVYLNGLGWVNDNEGIRIEGVENKRLLNLMISKGLFI